VAEGAVTIHEVCTAYILDPDGNHTAKWMIGKHVSRETYDQFKEADGSMYVIVHFEAGEPKATLINKALWEHAKGVLDGGGGPVYHQPSVSARL
jgi:hypothetical protein